MSVPRVILASLEINAVETSSTQNFNAQTLRNNKKINRAHTKKKSFAKRNATAINGPPKEEEDEKDNIAALREQLAALKLCLNNMNERMAESEMDCMDLDDKMDTHCKVVCSKIKCLAKATGNE